MWACCAGSRVDGFPTTPIKVRGYLAGDIVYRDVPPESAALARVPFPNAWNTVSGAVCAGLFAVNSQPQTAIPFQRLSVSAAAQVRSRRRSFLLGRATTTTRDNQITASFPILVLLPLFLFSSSTQPPRPLPPHSSC